MSMYVKVKVKKESFFIRTERLLVWGILKNNSTQCVRGLMNILAMS